MFPLTCDDGQEHDFKSAGEEEYVCSNCNLSYDDYADARDKLIALKDKIKELTQFVNGGSHEFLAEAFYEAMRETHRTIQQNFFRSMVSFIGKMKDMGVDARNEACVAWCQEVSKIESNFPRI